MPFDGAGFVPGEHLQKIDQIIDLIRTPDRWGKGSFYTFDGGYCLRGAIMQVDTSETLRPIILKAINEVTGRHYWRIETFNDHPQTDHKQVLAVLIRARENVEAGRIVTAPLNRLRRSFLARPWRV